MKPTEQFDDPELKLAVRQAWGGQSTPEELRRRVLQAMAGHSANPLPSRPPLKIHRSQLRQTAFRLQFQHRPVMRLVAAVFLVALVGVAIHATLNSVHDEAEIDHATLISMVRTHDTCCNEHANPDTDANADVTLIGHVLGQRLQQHVFAPRLAEEGWRFHGAAICPVGERRSAHIVFARNEQRLSVFSFVARDYATAKVARCSKAVENHIIAGMVNSGEIHCMVGYCPNGGLQQREVNELFERHRGEIVDAMLAAQPIPPITRR